MKRTAPAIAIILSIASIAIAAEGCDGTFTFDEHSVDSGIVSEGGAGTPDTAGDGPSGAACSSDTQCGGARCDVPTHVCVACLDNADCKDPARRFCTQPLQYCVECVTNDTCGARKRCDTSAHRCVDACAEGDEDCPSGLSCNEDRNLCVECKGNANCAGNPNGNFCDTAIGRCVECASSAQCPTNKPACDRRTGRCAECITSLACGNGRLCDPSALICRDP